MNTATLQSSPSTVDDAAPCAGTLIVHHDYFTECTDDPCCGLPAFAHEFTAHCDDVSCCPA